MKILRGMYERAVIARYLHLHPNEAEDFVDYGCISQFKVFRAIKEILDGIPKEALGKTPDEFENEFEKAKSSYDQVWEKFQITDCKKCNTKRLNHTWSKLDFVSMARKVAELRPLLVPAYYDPTEHIHCTFQSIHSRLRETANGAMDLPSKPQRQEAETTFRIAHWIFLDMIKLQMEHFELSELKGPLNKCESDFRDIWSLEDQRPDQGN